MKKCLSQLTVIMLASTAMLGCQPPTESKQPIPAEVETIAKTPLIEVSNQRVALPQQQICDEQSCTRFDIQTVHTNLDWINADLQQRLKEIEPQAFEKYQASSLEGVDREQLALNQVAMNVRYIAQHGSKASFVIHSYSYHAGAAHGMYHHEYVNYDLIAKKRIGLSDLIIKGKEQQFAEHLYQANQTWLMDHQVPFENLKLSDNFYYGAQGLVLVYPLYEMASYAEGMTELLLPYSVASGLVKAEYLPVLPEAVAP